MFPHHSHPATDALLGDLTARDHLPDDLSAISALFGDLAKVLAEELPSDPETTVCLRKLLEAKDCAVRAAVHGRQAARNTVVVTTQG